jgi:hypothetical protein
MMKQILDMDAARTKTDQLAPYEASIIAPNLIHRSRCNGYTVRAPDRPRGDWRRREKNGVTQSPNSCCGFYQREQVAQL